MTRFEALFGIRNTAVKKNCILMPLLPKGILKEFGIRQMQRGKLYACGNSKNFTLIHTGVGSGFVGDAVLYLKETPCRNIILFGSCGLASKKKNLSIASLVSPSKCYARESFSELLLKKDAAAKVFFAHKGLLKKLLEASRNIRVKEVTSLTISSLRLEQYLSDVFLEKGIDVVEMECSAFFSAASCVGLKAAAIFYVADIIKKHPFYRDLGVGLKATLCSSIKNAAGFLCEFTKKPIFF